MSSSRRSPGVAMTATRRFADQVGAPGGSGARGADVMRSTKSPTVSQARRVVRVVDQDLDAVQVEQVEPARAPGRSRW